MKPPVAAANGPNATTTSHTTANLSAPELQTASAPRATRPCGPRTLESRDLFGDQAMVLIQHLGEVYRLQTTRQGKLILTK